MINVCVVNPNYYRSSGVTVCIRRIYDNLPRAGITWHFVDCGYGDEHEDTLWIPRDRLVKLSLMTSSPVSLIHACVAFLRYVRKHDIQVVHVHHRRLALLLNGLRAFSSYRLIYTGHLTYRYSFLFWLCSPPGLDGGEPIRGR